MRSATFSLAVGLAVLVQGDALAQRGRFNEQEAVRNGWQFSLEAAKTQARKENKPLLVVMRCVP